MTSIHKTSLVVGRLLAALKDGPEPTSHLMALTGMSKSSVSRWCRGLTEAGVLAIDKRPNGAWSNGGRLEHVFELLVRRDEWMAAQLHTILKEQVVVNG